jgi:fatty acid desaturase
VKITLTIFAFLAGRALFVIVGDSRTTLAVAAWPGIIFTQLGFTGHHAGHGQVFGTRRRNRLLGLTAGNVLIGLSFGWRVHQHNAHHAHPDEMGRDPDIGEGVAPASSGAPGNGRGPLASWLARWQAVLSLYLGISFAPNHKGTPIIETATAAGFARRQVVTARNITGGRFTDFILGGLNYQIEHHLFPSMPRPSLRRVQGLVRDFCAAADLCYREESFAGSFRQIIQHLSGLRAASRVQAPLAPEGAARSPAAGGGGRRADGRYPGARQTASTLLPPGSRTNAPQ